MLTLYWTLRLFRDIILQGWINRTLGLSIVILLFMLIGIVIVSAQVAAPFIYTLF
jgi:hypothetical protein